MDWLFWTSVGEWLADLPLPSWPISDPTLSRSNRRPVTPSAAVRRGWPGTGVRKALQKGSPRSEEHTSELHSHLNLVCPLLLEKQKTTRSNTSPLTIPCRISRKREIPTDQEISITRGPTLTTACLSITSRTPVANPQASHILPP